MSLPSGTLAGYEALGRGRHPRLPEAPLDLFRIAAGVGAEAELSQLFRETALELVLAKGRFPALFLNVHPSELEKPGLVPAVVEARQKVPHLRLTLEVHEGALADLESVDRLRTQLSRSGVGIAYDDFGAGQARLLELAEVPPHYLKFDMSFVRGIDTAPASRQRLLTSLVSVARDLLVYTVAEGVETAEEADVCMRIGFTHAQGFFFGRPRPIEREPDRPSRASHSFLQEERPALREVDRHRATDLARAAPGSRCRGPASGRTPRLSARRRPARTRGSARPAPGRPGTRRAEAAAALP